MGIKFIFCCYCTVFSWVYKSFVTSGGTLSAIHNCLIKIHSEATATFNSGSYSLIDLVNIKGSDIVVANGNYLEVYFGGISWSTI